MSDDLGPMMDELVIRGTDDWVMAAEVAHIARSMGRALGAESIRGLSIILIGRLLEDGLMEIGEVSDGGFFEWGLPIDEAIERADRAWNDLGRPPNLGEVCWLANTGKGTLLAEQLLKQRGGGRGH